MTRLASLFAVLALSSTAAAQGFLKVDSDRYDGVPLAPRLSSGALPNQVDLSRYFPPPGDQGDRQGSCVAWSVGYGLESYLQARRNGWRPTTAAHEFSPSYVFNQLHPSYTCDAGLDYLSALDLLQQRGDVPLSAFPYRAGQCNAQPSASVDRVASQYRIGQYYRVDPSDIDQVRARLAAGVPILIGMDVGDSFERLRGRRIYNGGGDETDSHAMVAIGYDDARGAIEVLNSWGRRWGDRGYGWIGYDAFQNLVEEAYMVDDRDLPPVAQSTATSDCPSGSSWNEDANGCVCNEATPQWDEASSTCIATDASSDACPPGSTFDAQSDQCTCDAATPTWDEDAGRCVAQGRNRQGGGLVQQLLQGFFGN